MALSTLTEKANTSRLSRLLIDKGTQALRQVFDTQVQTLTSSGTLHDLLNAKKRSLQSLRYKVINTAQWRLLYPSSGSADSKCFDVTLLTCLLRSACRLPPPKTGWKIMPPDADTSIAANILRIKIYRNEVFGHVTRTGLDDNQFETSWNKIANALVGLGIPRSEIDALKEEPLSAEEEDYIDQLIAWKKEEDDLKDLITDYHHEVREIISKIPRSEKEDISRVEELAKCVFRGTIRKLTSTFHKGTRAWLFEKVNSWFTDPESESQVMILTAGPGFGKSVFAAKVCEIYEKEGKLAACHFCRFNDSNRGNPHRLIQSLASHMCENIDGFKAELDKELQRCHSSGTLGEAFQVLLNNPLYALENREPMIIVVDGLDESEVGGKSELLGLISEEFPFLPKWIKILITSRPELHVKDKLSRLNPVEILPTNKDNETDIRSYLEACLSSTSVSGGVLSSLVRHCKGSFLFAYYLQEELRDKNDQLMENHPKLFEVKGIAAFYESQFNRVQSYFREYAPTEVDFKRFLDVVAVGGCQTQFPLELLRKSIDWPESADIEFRRLISEMSSLFPVSDDCLTAYHISLIEWLWGVNGHEKHPFTVDVRKGNEYLWSTCKELFNDLTSLEYFSDLKITPVIRYGLEHGMKHLFEVHGGKDYHWLVDSKLNHIRSNSCPSRLLDDWRGASTLSSLPPGTRYKIWRLHNCDSAHSVFRRYFNWQLERVRAGQGAPSLYLQMVANGLTVINDDLSDIESAISLLGKGKYVWCEDLNVDNFQSKFAKFNSSRLEAIRVVAISPDQQWAAATYEGNSERISLLQLPNFELLYEYDSKLTNVQVCAFAPDNSVLVYGCMNSCLDVKSRKEIPFIGNHSDKFLSCSFSPSGNRLVTADSSSFVKLWDVNQKRLLHQFETCNGVGIDFCSFSRSGLFIVANKGGSPDSLAIWNSLTLQRIDQRFLGLERNTPTSSPSPVELVEWFQYPVTTTEDSEYTILGYETGSLVFQLPQGLPVCRSQIPFHPLCVTELGGSYSCVLTSVLSSFIVLDLASRTIVAEHRMNCQPFYTSWYTPVFLNEGSFLLKEMPFISFKTPDQLKFVSPLSRVTITCCTFSDDGLFLATCDNHNFVRIWSVQTCSVAQTHCLKAPAIAGWWSKGCLWFVLPQYLVKIPSAEQHKLIFHELEYRPIDSIKDFLAFSDGVLVGVFSSYSIRVMKIVDDVIEGEQILPMEDVFDSVSVGPHGCSILLCSTTKCQLWKQVEGDVSKTWQPSPSILHHCSSLDIEKAGQYRASKCFITPGRTGGILIGIIAVFGFSERIIFVVDLSVGRVTKVIKELRHPLQYIPHFRDHLLLSPSLVICRDDELNVCIHGLSDGALLAVWKVLLGDDLIPVRNSVLGYSYRHNLLAIPQGDGYVEFVKIHGTERLRSVSDNTMW